ncbi:MAG TPA: hypothetical protein VFD06_02370, partial [Candidatus Polarisedimenticolia bacterium]|nr:hypothetical protein [Candidatus Polarisedimenticolia bacterium]
MRPNLFAVIVLCACALAADRPVVLTDNAGALSKEEAAALAAEVAPIVEEIRGAKFKHPVPVEIVDDQAARAHFKTRLQE